MVQWHLAFGGVGSCGVKDNIYLFQYRGKGDYYRLGHGTDTHVRKPQLVEGLKDKKIVHISVGALHCLAVTETGQVCQGHTCGF